MADRARGAIRPLTADDRSAWAPLWEGYNTFYERTIPADVTEMTWARLMTPGEDPSGFGAIDADGRLIGFTHYHFHRSTSQIGPSCYLQDLFVSPDGRGSGAGRALIEAVCEVARARGCRSVYWHTHDDNARARALYDKVAVLSPFVRYDHVLTQKS